MSAPEIVSSASASSKWVTTIGAICDQFSGDVQTGPFGSQLHASDYSELGTPVVMPQDMIGGRIVCDRIARVSEKHVLALKRHVLREGDLVFSRRGDVTRFAVVTESEAGWLCGTGSIRIRLNCPNILIGYARRYLQKPEVGAWLLNEAKGVTMPNLNTQIIRALPFVFPPLEEQRRIAAILDQAETLRTQRRQALAHLDTLTQSLFLDMFGDPLDVPKRWTWLRMSELFETSPIFGTMIPGDADGGSWLCLRVANIQDWQLTLEDKKYVDLPESAVKRHSVMAGDLLMARAIASQDHLGKCIVAQPGEEQWAFDSHLMRLRFRADRALPDFIRQMLRTPGGRKLFLKASRKSSVQYNINTKEISALEIPVPPVALQQTFATRIQTIEALKATHRAALAQLDALFASLQQQAFSGELTRSTAAAAAVATHTKPDLSAMCMLDAKKMLEALIYVTNRMPEHNFYKSLKALYTGDRQHLENHGCLIYGETYEAMEHGPVPKAAYALTKTLEEAASSNLFADDPMSIPLRRTENQLIPARDADFDVLSAAERKSLDWAIKYYAPMNFGDTKTASHDSAYLATALNAPIAIEDIIRTLPAVAQRRFFG